MTTAAETTLDPHLLIRREIVSRQLAEQLMRLRERGPLKILDVGCGPSSPSLLLARAGHLVTGVSTDTERLTDLHSDLAHEPADVQTRLRLVEGDGAEAGRHFPPGSFDLALCHDVLEALPEPDGMLAALSRVLTQGGLISVTSRNAGSLAMRPGSRGQWSATRKALAAAALADGGPGGSPRADTADNLSEVLSALGSPVLQWYGVGVFANLQDPARLPDRGSKGWQTMIACEEESGRMDPYRGIAAVVHLIGEKTVR